MRAVRRRPPIKLIIACTGTNARARNSYANDDISISLDTTFSLASRFSCTNTPVVVVGDNEQFCVFTRRRRRRPHHQRARRGQISCASLQVHTKGERYPLDGARVPLKSSLAQRSALN